MSEQFFAGASEMAHDFAGSSRETYDAPLDHDAQDWEPIEEPSEQHAEMHFTPGGALEQEVHTQIDEAARERIIEAQNERVGERGFADEKELDFAGDFDDARRNAWGWDPESQREYEGFRGEFNTGHGDGSFRAGRPFEPELGDDHWER